MTRILPRKALVLALSATLLAAAPALSFAQAQPAAAAATQGSPSQLVLDNTQRVLKTIEARRAEFTRDRVALRKFIEGEFTQMFDRDYAARLVLGRHARGASDAVFSAFILRCSASTPTWWAEAMTAISSSPESVARRKSGNTLT